MRVKYAEQFLKSKNRFISDVLQNIPTHAYSSVGRPTKTFFLWANTGYRLDNQPSAIPDCDRWCDRVRNPYWLYILIIRMLMIMAICVEEGKPWF